MAPKVIKKKSEEKRNAEELSENQYLAVSDTNKKTLQACNLTEDELQVIVKTTKRLNAGLPLKDQMTPKELIWRTLAKVMGSTQMVEVTTADTPTEAKTKNEKFEEDKKVILTGNGDEKAKIVEVKKVCPHYNRGPNYCKYGVVGNGCENEHPESCPEFDKKGDRGCENPCGKGLHHRPVCQKLTAQLQCTLGKKCRAYHPPEFEKWARKELEKRAKEDEEQAKKTKEQAEVKAFLEQERPKMERENQELKQRVQDLEANLMIARNTPTQMPIQQHSTVQQSQGIQEQLNQIQAMLQQLRIQPIPMTPQPMQMQAMPQRESPQMQQLQWQQNQHPHQN